MTVPLSNIRTFLNTISVLVHLFWAIYFSRKGRGPFPHHYAILPVYMTTIVALANFQEIYLRFSECALRRSYFVGLQLETLPLKDCIRVALKPVSLLKKNSMVDDFLWVLLNILTRLLTRPPVMDCSGTFRTQSNI